MGIRDSFADFIFSKFDFSENIRSHDISVSVVEAFRNTPNKARANESARGGASAFRLNSPT